VKSDRHVSWFFQGCDGLLTRLLKKQGLAPKRMITDKLRSYRAAKRQVMPDVEYRAHKGLNNRAENSHVPPHKRERTMQGFRSPGSLQRFVSIFSSFRNLFVPAHSKRSPFQIHLHRLNVTAEWKAVTPSPRLISLSAVPSRPTSDNVIALSRLLVGLHRLCRVDAGRTVCQIRNEVSL